MHIFFSIDLQYVYDFTSRMYFTTSNVPACIWRYIWRHAVRQRKLNKQTKQSCITVSSIQNHRCAASGEFMSDHMISTALPSLTRFACDTREYVFSHAHTQMNENHTRIGKLAEI